MKFKIVKGNRKMPKKFAEFAELLATMPLEALDEQVMYRRVFGLQIQFEGENANCNFFLSKGAADWLHCSSVVCYLYENRSAYLNKTYLLAIQKDLE
jgi:hypothetical protein